MAYLIPENIPSRSDIPAAVQDIARTLRDHVDENVTVWYEEGEAPLLIILDPSAGLLLLEVSALSPRDLKRTGFLGLRSAHTSTEGNCMTSGASVPRWLQQRHWRCRLFPARRLSRTGYLATSQARSF
jgi:hypothetical protein